MENTSMVNTGIVNIRISPDYFRRCARNDYSSPIPWVWIREVIQNSTDAGAADIDIQIDGEHITVVDNGSGMDADIIVNKLLTLGGSQKNSDNATGGFGKAKEILFFCWDEWSIQTSNDTKNRYYVDNTMIEREPVRHETGSFSRGTTVKIRYDPNENSDLNWQRNIREFVATCSVKARIYLNGDLLEQLPNRGTKIEYDNFTMRINKSQKKEMIYVRVNGVTMFTEWIYASIAATVTIELKGKSVDMLSANRDSLRYEQMAEFKRIYKTILTNPKEIERKANPETIHLDRYSVKQAEIVRVQIEQQYAQKPEIVQVAHAAIEACVRGEKSLTDSLICDMQELDPEVAETLRIVVNGGYVSKMGYPFVVRRHNGKVPAIDPTTPKAHTILHAWKHIIEEVIRENNVDIDDYRVGFTFDPEVKGSYLVYNDDVAGSIPNILINPTIIKQYSDAVGMGLFMHPIACHEVGHIRYTDHDESFAIHWGNLMEGLGNNHKKWNQVFVKAKSESAKLIKQNRAA